MRKHRPISDEEYKDILFRKVMGNWIMGQEEFDKYKEELIKEYDVEM